MDKGKCRISRFFLIFFAGILFTVSCGQQPSEKLTIAAAANMQYAIEELTSVFSEETGILCEVVISSSGKLTAQVVGGAPFDALLSADMKYPELLFQKGLTIDEPMVYAYGNLVLWTLKDEIDPVLESLSKDHIKYIAVGNPKTAPYGISAMQVLEKFGGTKNMRNKLVFGESISQTNQFIISKVADLGFTSKSVVLSPGMKDMGTWKPVDRSLYEPIAQGIVILNSRDLFQKEAMQFRDFLLSVKGKEILYKFGYEVEN
jgi:molybdate transport system substrate-binding protein